jgi:Lanthionine synthetase C-like protein
MCRSPPAVELMRSLTSAERAVVESTPSAARRRIADNYPATTRDVAPNLSRLDLGTGRAGVLLTASLIQSLTNSGRSPEAVSAAQIVSAESVDASPGSLLFGGLGVAYARAVAEILGIGSLLPTTLEVLLRLCARADGTDIYDGRAGALMACVSLSRHLRIAGCQPSEVLRSAAETHATVLGRNLQADKGEDLNLAHGLAGTLYALLKYAREFEDEAVMPEVRAALRSLASLVRFDADGQPLWQTIQPWLPASLCNGSAGQLLLALEAREGISVALDDGLEPFLLSASTFGHTCSHLCCGLAGQAYALMTAYRSIADVVLLARSLKLAEAAAIIFMREPRDLSLFRGQGSIAWYSACLDAGFTPALPLFEL